MKFTCPRRIEDGAVDGPFTFAGKDIDSYRDDNTCSYCGSFNPDTLIEKLDSEGATLTPTDKNYKVYVDLLNGESVVRNTKFYFQHFNEEQKKHFIDLLNDKKLKIEYPGHFYVLPFFIKR